MENYYWGIAYVSGGQSVCLCENEDGEYQISSPTLCTTNPVNCDWTSTIQPAIRESDGVVAVESQNGFPGTAGNYSLQKAIKTPNFVSDKSVLGEVVEIMLIEISDTVLLQVPAYASAEDVKVDFAVWLYECGRLTLAQAARLCDRTRLQFQKILKEKGVHLHYSSEDIQVDLQNM